MLSVARPRRSRSDPRRAATPILLAILLVATPPVVLAQIGDVNAAAQRVARTSVQAGDKIFVKVYREPELTDSVMVSSDGTIVLARIGTVLVTPLSINQLTDTVRARYGRFLRSPAVELVVLRRVAVNGEVLKPNVYYVDVATTLRDVIAKAGGITPDGRDDVVDIIRRGERIRVANWQDDFTLASDLNSGDQVVVGKRSWLSRNAFQALSAFTIVASLIVSLRR
jgi:protein involved in polysaccharide export with SLBB domain